MIIFYAYNIDIVNRKVGGYDMKIVLIAILAVIIIINLASFFYGRTKLRNFGKGEEEDKMNYKKGMRYVVLSVILSFLSIIIATILVIIKFLHK